MHLRIYFFSRKIPAMKNKHITIRATQDQISRWKEAVSLAETTISAYCKGQLDVLADVTQKAEQPQQEATE